jgi:5-formyltetrahydrofolate cyclo-ligase
VSLAEAKAALRRAAAAGRAGLKTPARDAAAAARLAGVLAGQRGRVVAGYLPMRSEADPLPALAAHAGPVCMPVVAGRGRPLIFRAWAPGVQLEAGAFGTLVPPTDAPALVPQVLVVPLLAFDRRGFRLGYGGGFYDRTLAGLRAAGPVLALGYAFAGQEVEAVPTEATDTRLDLIVTEAGVIAPG